MRIKKTDWHYRWLKRSGMIREYGTYNSSGEWVHEVSGPKSICPYFWSLMLVSVAPVASVLALLIVVIRNWEATLGLIAVVIAIALFVGFVVLLLLAVREISRWGERRAAARPYVYKEPQPNIAWEFAKAQKRKICPLLEFTD